MSNILRKRKNYFLCTNNQKILQKKLICTHTEDLSTLSQTIGLTINEIILTPENHEQSIPKITILPENITNKERIIKFLIAKDLANLSNLQYIAQRKALLGIHKMPGLKKILSMQKKLNNFFAIDANDYGYYCSPTPKIRFVCEQFLLKNPEFSQKKFKIKLSIDSTTITSSNILLLNLSFNLIDDQEKATSINGTYLLGSFEIVKEEYEQIKSSLKELLIELEKIKFIEIADNIYGIDFYLGCDYKMIRILYGQKASNSLDGCFWCPALMNEAPNEANFDKYNLSRRLSDPIDHKERIINFIEPQMCIIDDLHLLLRVTDKLYDLLLLKFIRLDKNDGSDLKLRKNLSVFIHFLKENCKIKNPFYLTEKRPNYGKIQFRSFNGNERIRIFKELYEPKYNKASKEKTHDALFLSNLPFLKPENINDHFKKEDLLWLGFYELYNKFKDFPKISSITERKSLIEPMKKMLKDWLFDFLFVSKINKFSERFSPYTHCLVFHYYQMLELHGNIHVYSTQPNEKLNDFCTKYYHRNTNKNNVDKNYLFQLLKKRNRIEYYNLEGDFEDILTDDDYFESDNEED